MERVGPETNGLPFSIPCKTLDFDGNFHEIAFISAPRVSKSGPEKKWTDNTQTDTQTESDRSGAPLGQCFDQLRYRSPSQILQNQVPKRDLGILLTSQLKGTSGLPRSLALSSSCAWSAIIYVYITFLKDFKHFYAPLLFLRNSATHLRVFQKTKTQLYPK